MKIEGPGFKTVAFTGHPAFQLTPIHTMRLHVRQVEEYIWVKFNAEQMGWLITIILSQPTQTPGVAEVDSVCKTMVIYSDDESDETIRYDEWGKPFPLGVGPDDTR